MTVRRLSRTGSVGVSEGSGRSRAKSSYSARVRATVKKTRKKNENARKAAVTRAQDRPRRDGGGGGCGGGGAGVTYNCCCCRGGAQRAGVPRASPLINMTDGRRRRGERVSAVVMMVTA